MTAQWYVHDTLQPQVLPLMQRLPGATFQQDDARPHTTRMSQDCLNKGGEDAGERLCDSLFGKRRLSQFSIERDPSSKARAIILRENRDEKES
ncbi:hypothetical protein TNCV_5066541 [Trichonephila clavipes]|nr:hypothetical protein TNCV_5066541 [Trichonephila clavipes]